MTEEEKPAVEDAPQAEEPAAEAAPAADEAAPAVDTGSSDAEEGKAFAILSYALSFIGLPFFLVPLIMRNNEFALYHAKQSLMIWLAGVAVSVVGGILSAVCIGFIILPVGAIILLVLNIMGLVNAVKLEAKPVPMIGKWAENWFKGITKTS